jgi:MoaA/NifB/PqqE/SkfB family radical SAM enzyme
MLVMKLEKATKIIFRSLTPNRPYHVQWFITRKCNYRCRGCNVWREQNGRELTTEEVKRGLDILRELGVIDVVFSGGNPLHREDMGEIIDYSSRFFITTIYDNGSMAVKNIDALRNADFVAISVDSLNKKKNDYVRGAKGALHNALEAIKRLREENISCSISPTISQFNLDEILDMTKYFTNMDVPIWYCLYYYDLSEHEKQLFRIGKKSDEFLITDKEAMVKLCDALIEEKKKNSNILITSKVLNAVKQLFVDGKRSWKCKALQNFLAIDHLGRVGGCHVHNPVSSIFDLPKVWNSSKFDVLRNIYHECTQCNYLCYIFYSLHGSVVGNFQIAQEHWKNAGLLFKK